MQKKIGLLMGSINDFEKIKPAIDQLKALDIPFEAHNYSAHRTPEQACGFARAARENGFAAIICAAGVAAHLGGVVASMTTLPVIAIPLTGRLDGLDALLSMAQMPPGMPVGTMAINGAKNAALFAAQILAVEDADLADKLAALREKNVEDILAQDAKLQGMLQGE